jgi:hypothetical protein
MHYYQADITATHDSLRFWTHAPINVQGDIKLKITISYFSADPQTTTVKDGTSRGIRRRVR